MGKLDIIIFGVTGFTGKYLLEYVVELLKSEKGPKFTYGIAARSEKKMKILLEEVSASTGVNLSSVPTMEASIEDQASLLVMASRGKVVLNCVGPIFTGKQEVVDACIEAGTHCVDLNGAPLLVERIQRDCDEKAKEKKVCIVGSCGFDTVPVDMGVIHLIKNFGGDVNSVESYLEMDCNGKPPKIHFATWESILHGIVNASQLKPIREALFSIEPRLPSPKYKLDTRLPIHKNEVVNGWSVLYPRSDVPVVSRTQHLLYRLGNHRPVQIQAYMKAGSFCKALITALAAVYLGILIFFPFGLGRWLLLKYPELMTLGLVSRAGPSKEEMKNTKFTITLQGHGWSDSLAEPTDNHVGKPDKKKVVKVTGTNPAYGVASVCMLQSALTIISERDKMPKEGGVFTPGAAFSNTNLVSRLNENGVKFEVMDS